jgi:hypothetical protein
LPGFLPFAKKDPNKGKTPLEFLGRVLEYRGDVGMTGS